MTRGHGVSLSEVGDCCGANRLTSFGRFLSDLQRSMLLAQYALQVASPALASLVKGSTTTPIKALPLIIVGTPPSSWGHIRTVAYASLACLTVLRRLSPRLKNGPCFGALNLIPARTLATRTGITGLQQPSRAISRSVKRFRSSTHQRHTEGERRLLAPLTYGQLLAPFGAEQ